MKETVILFNFVHIIVLCKPELKHDLSGGDRQLRLFGPVFLLQIIALDQFLGAFQRFQ